MPIPNFLIIGTAKAGTSSLYHYLNQHPQIYMSPVKEPRFFAPELYTEHCKDPYREGAKQHRDVPMSFEEYCQLFEGAVNEVALGEASTEYLYMPKTPERIQQHIPSAKLIAILRDPAERAFSAFCYQLRDGCEKLTFEQALAAESQRITENKWWPGWHYKQSGFYYEQLKRYFQVFDPSQIKVYLHDELSADPTSVVKDIFRFVGVEDDFTPTLTRKNVSGIPQNRFLHSLMTRNNPLKAAVKPFLPDGLRQRVAQNIHQQNMQAKPTLSPEIRHTLVEDYRQDILNLQDLLQRDLSKWLAV